MRAKLLICITGMPGSGKSIVVAAARDLGLPVVSMGDIVREETFKRYGVITPELLRNVTRLLREEHGSTVVAERTVERIEKLDPGDVVVVDGVRSLDELEVFRKKYEVVVVAVHASPKTRFERIRRRSRPGDPKEWSEFVKRDLLELSLGLGNVIALADYMIVNEAGIDEAYKRAREILEGLVNNVRKSRSRG